MLAEAIGGNEGDFVAKMNAAAQRLGMSRTKFVNPNGLPADDQVTTARDLAKLSRAIVTDFPEFAHYWSMPQMRLGKNRVRSHNGLLDTVEGADGMKTGFTCDSGFNIVASATRDGRRLVAVVLGDSSIADRNTRAAGLLEYGFQQTGLTQGFNTQTVDSMPLNPSAEGAKSVRASIESWACNPKPHIINAHKGGKKTAKKGAKKDKDAVKAAQANTDADTTTGALQTEVKPVLRAEE
jgi:D-alanyl-D-alanine carboxypeptidase